MFDHRFLLFWVALSGAGRDAWLQNMITSWQSSLYFTITIAESISAVYPGAFYVWYMLHSSLDGMNIPMYRSRIFAFGHAMYRFTRFRLLQMRYAGRSTQQAPSRPQNKPKRRASKVNLIPLLKA